MAAATVNLLVLTSKSPSIPTAPLALIAAAVVVPSTLRLPSKSVAPATSNVPGISTLLVHSTPVPAASVCNTCLEAPSFNLLTSISAVGLISMLTIVPSFISVLVTA